MTRSIAGRHRTGRLVAATVGIAAVAATTLLAGCSAGQVAETAQIVSAVPGGNQVVKVPDPTNVNSEILIQNVTVAYNGLNGYAAGANAPLAMRIINQTQSPIRVSPGLATVTGVKATAAPTPLGTVAWAGGARPVLTPASAPASAPGSPGTSPSGAPSAPASPSAPPSTPAVPDLLIPAGSIAILAPDVAGSIRFLQISSLSQALLPGDLTNVGLTFTVFTADGAAQTYATSVQAPIAPPVTAQPRVSVDVTGGTG